MRAGEVIADQFELVRIAGAGGMGQVWEARDRLQDARVAVKLLTGTSQRGRARFLREAVMLAQLRHPGIVRYVAHGVTSADEIYLVMEWLEGEDLAQRLERGAISTEDTVTLLRGVAEA
ncbi:MAG: protein kinase, partial [Polyangiaceae bacterium]